METQNANNEMINWLYTLKKVLVYKIFSNPIVMSDIIDIFSEIVYARYTQDIKRFEFIDSENSIVLHLTNSNNVDYNMDIRVLISDCMIKFCTLHRAEIEAGMMAVGGFNAKNMFTDAIENNRSSLLAQIVTLQIYPINIDDNGITKPGYFVKVRFY